MDSVDIYYNMVVHRKTVCESCKHKNSDCDDYCDVCIDGSNYMKKENKNENETSAS